MCICPNILSILILFSHQRSNLIWKKSLLFESDHSIGSKCKDVFLLLKWKAGFLSYQTSYVQKFSYQTLKGLWDTFFKVIGKTRMLLIGRWHLECTNIFHTIVELFDLLRLIIGENYISQYLSIKNYSKSFESAYTHLCYLIQDCCIESISKLADKRQHQMTDKINMICKGHLSGKW